MDTNGKLHGVVMVTQADLTQPNQTQPDPTRSDLIRPYLDRTPESTRCKQNRPYKSQTNLIRVVLT